MAEDWMDKLSKPQYRVKTEKDIFIAARDGVRLAADIYRPDAEGKFPALLFSVSPYGKDVQKLKSPRGPLEPRARQWRARIGRYRLFCLTRLCACDFRFARLG